MKFSTEDLVRIIERSRGQSHSNPLLPYTAGEPSKNELCFFVKPTLTRADVFERVWPLIADRLEHFSCEAVACDALYGPSLESDSLMEQHYGVLSQYSKCASRRVAEFDPIAVKDLNDRLGGEAQILGGHEFLEQYPFFSAEALACLHDNSPSVRLASGAYAAAVEVNGMPVGVVNGFQPAQMSDFYSRGSVILVMIVRSSSSWHSLRKGMIGATNPKRATEGSIRRLLMDKRDELKLGTFDALRNGVHLSAGPLEGIVEVSRFGPSVDARPLSPQDTTLGSELAKNSPIPLELMLDNPLVDTTDGSQTLFDATEEVDAARLISVLSGFSLFKETL